MADILSQEAIDAPLNVIDEYDDVISLKHLPLSQKDQEEIDAILDVIDEDDVISLNYSFFLESNLIKEIYKNSGSVFFNSQTESFGLFLIEIGGQVKSKNINELFFDCKNYLVNQGYYCISSSKENKGLAKLKWTLEDGDNEKEHFSECIKAKNEMKAVLYLTLLYLNNPGRLIFGGLE